MYVKRVLCKDFRVFENIDVELCKGVNIFYGNNAEGKTSFLESVYMCATGHSNRAGTDREMIRFGCRESHIQTYVVDGATDRIDVHLKKDEKKGIAINNAPIKTFGELFGILIVVSFSPEDLQLIKLGPAERRRFMDVELCQLSGVYYHELNQYHRILKQRNSLLKSVQKNPSLTDTIFVWDEQLVEHGTKIISFREEFVNVISGISKKIHSAITNGFEDMEIVYKPNVTAAEFYNKLHKNMEKDVINGNTMYGIHKDDLLFNINNTDCRIYGSQGQQRTVALSAKLAEIELVRDRKNTLPVLLLDDVLSELDRNRQRFLIEKIGDVQTLITCTGIEDVLNDRMEKLFRVADKNIAAAKSVKPVK